jgi:peptidyl-prolyl cis-trans isomerase B (cyclophilin B)
MTNPKAGTNQGDPLMSANPQADPQVTLDTSQGTIKIVLFASKAPGTVNNFLQYVDEGFYDNTIFHRVIADFMIQGGGFEAGMKQKRTRANITNESNNGLTNTRGTLAMARTPDPHSASSQFFINLKDNDFLNKARASDGWGYCVFGKVVEGMDVVDKIARAATTARSGHQDVPATDVVVRSARRS